MEFVKPVAEDVRIRVETDDARPFTRYSVMLQVRVGSSGWRTMHLLDNAHEAHDEHRYDGWEKRSATVFMEGSPQEALPAAMRYLAERWGAIITTWKS